MFLIKAPLNIQDYYKIIFEKSSFRLNNDALVKIDKSFDFLSKVYNKNIIYGINTGFGPMAQYKIKDRDQIQLQYNLIRSHASGTGKIISPMYVRASILARLNSFMLGYSGVHRSE